MEVQGGKPPPFASLFGSGFPGLEPMEPMEAPIHLYSQRFNVCLNPGPLALGLGPAGHGQRAPRRAAAALAALRAGAALRARARRVSR